MLIVIASKSQKNTLCIKIYQQISLQSDKVDVWWRSVVKRLPLQNDVVRVKFVFGKNAQDSQLYQCTNFLEIALAIHEILDRHFFFKGGHFENLNPLCTTRHGIICLWKVLWGSLNSFYTFVVGDLIINTTKSTL